MSHAERSSPRWSCLAILLALSCPCAAQPSGPEFRANTTTTGDQTQPVAAGISDFGFVVVWRGQDAATAYHWVFGQIVDNTGKPYGAEFRVNTYTSAYGGTPSVASDLAGNFVVVWSMTYVGSSYGSEIFGQRFNPLGQPYGTQFRVNTTVDFYQSRPSVAAPNGFPAGFVVVWENESAGDSADVVGQRFAPDGAPAGAPFRANTYTTGAQTGPRVAAYSGGFVVVWSSAQDGSQKSVHGQRFDPSAAPVGEEFRVNEHTTGFQFAPAIAMARDGGSFVVYRDDVGDGALTGVSGRFFAPSGTPGSEFRLNTYTTGNQDFPAVGVDIDGRFFAAWQSLGQDGSLNGIYARRFGPTGSVETPELRVNTYTNGGQTMAAVAGQTDYRFVVVWADDSAQEGDAGGVYGQVFCLVGDMNIDGIVNVTDVLYLINHLFAGGPQPIGCADANNDGAVNVSDVLYLINYLFAGGPAPL